MCKTWKFTCRTRIIIIISTYETISFRGFAKNTYHMNRESVAHFRKEKPRSTYMFRHSQAVAYLPLWIEKEIFMEFSISQSNDDAGCPVPCLTQYRLAQSTRSTQGNTLSVPGFNLLRVQPPKVNIVRITNFSFGPGSNSSMKKDPPWGQTLGGIGFAFSFFSLISKNGQTWWNGH